jgi:hypothetical protein
VSGAAEVGELGGRRDDVALLARLWERTGKFLFLAFQLGLAIIVIYQFEIESRAFLYLSILTFFGFAVHYHLPLAARLPFFLALSLAGIALVFGIVNAAWLIGLGLGLLGIAHLPLRFSARVGLLLATAVLLACLRSGWAPVPWSAAVWPILGSMFMFRLAVYLYDVQHEKEPAPWSQRLAYFFLLPNVCFPLFPVVDYKTFRRTYYEGERHQIYQVGLLWIVRGIVHLVMYRFVYYYCTLAPSEVASFPDLARYMLSTFLLYLRVSGQFHLIAGMLHLFGFNLPETHHLYYLASSFNDFWRRINIYWKDFMMKLFYYPVFFKLRKRGPTLALVLSTLVVFAGTWMLHSYQWFWLRGSFPITLQDGLFWSILGGLVVVNSLREARHGRARSLGRRTRSFQESTVLVLRTAGTFVSICVLWSLWNSESISEWLSLWAAAVRGGPGIDVSRASWLPLLCMAAVAGGALPRPSHLRGGDGSSDAKASFRRNAVRTFAWILPLIVIAQPTVYTRLGPTVADVVDSLRRSQLSRHDAAQLQKGYYEDLVRVDRFNSQLWELYMKRPVRWEIINQTAATRPTHDIEYFELVPEAKIEFHGAPFSVNRSGLRDRDYDVAKPPGTHRIAMLGSSHVAGEGVGDGEPFEAKLEELLNADQVDGRPPHYEILNFGVGAYTPLEIFVRFERKALAFQPDAVFYVAHAIDMEQVVARLIIGTQEGVEIPYEFLRETVSTAGVERGTPTSVATRLLDPYGPELLGWIYAQIVQETRAHGAAPVWIFLPRISERLWRNDVDQIIRLAMEAGFTIVDLQGMYDGLDFDAIRVGEWDNHPNARGHELIAQRLFETLRELPDQAPLGLSSTGLPVLRQDESRPPMEKR